MTTHGSTPSNNEWSCQFGIHGPWLKIGLPYPKPHYIGQGTNFFSLEPRNHLMSWTQKVEWSREWACMWCSKAEVALQWQFKLDIFISAPSSLVFVHGIIKLTNLVPLAVTPVAILVECAMWAWGLKLESMRSSPKWQQDQNAMHASVKTAVSKALVRSRWQWRALRWSMVTGSLLAWWDDDGTTLAAP